MSSLLYGPGTETLAVVVLNSADLGQLQNTAALAVLVTLVVLIPPLLAWWLIRRLQCSRPGAQPMPSEPVLELDRADRRLRPVTALDGVDVGGAAGRGGGAAGPVRLRQVDPAECRRGFLAPSAGTIGWPTPVADADRAEPPERRDVGVVFQNYALWPHLTAVDTVAYPMRRRGCTARPRPGAEARRILALLHIAGWPTVGPPSSPAVNSSGWGSPGRWPGRRRCTCSTSRPRIWTRHVRGVFLDELVARRSATGAAALYATHDAEEALGLADRVALLNGGTLVQIGTPQEVYDRPVDPWAARLTGPASVLTLPTRARCWSAPVGPASAVIVPARS